jgi:hypothetical protein
VTEREPFRLDHSPFYAAIPGLCCSVQSCPDVTCLSGKVWKRLLLLVSGAPGADAPTLKRLLLPQGELAQIHDSEEPLRYLAVIELRAGTVRGNHFHKVKREFIYLVSGGARLIVEDLASNDRADLPLGPAELVFIPPAVAHALQVTASGLAIEFSQARFDPTDTYRHLL